jgi:hypothetical protein
MKITIPELSVMTGIDKPNSERKDLKIERA